MRLNCKVIMICALGAASVSCASTANTAQNREAAVLLNADKSEIRESIRVFVRQDAGRFVRAEPDSLSLSPNMIIHRRARDFEARSRTLPPANLDYRLVTDGTNCWLMRHETGLDSPITAEHLLPDSAQCALYSQNKG